MYAPSVPPSRNENTPSTTHLHQPNETLTEHEDRELFKTYLTGRKLAYNTIIADIYQNISNANKVLDRNPADPALRALITGQIEAAQEILQLLKKTKENDNT